jgi:hypothetical protein
VWARLATQYTLGIPGKSIFYARAETNVFEIGSCRPPADPFWACGWHRCTRQVKLSKRFLNRFSNRLSSLPGKRNGNKNGLYRSELFADINLTAAVRFIYRTASGVEDRNRCTALLSTSSV